MQHSEFEVPTDSGQAGGAPEPSGDPVAAQIAAALDQGDHETAGNLLRLALEATPEDNRLLRLAAKQRRQAERFTRIYSLLRETGEAIEGDSFVNAVGAFREAANLCQGFPAFERATFEVAVDEAEKLGDRNWRVARSLLEDAGRINPHLFVPEKLLQQIAAAERAETIANVLSETALAKPAELERARDRLTRTLELYPNDIGLSSRLKSIESTIEDKRKWDARQKRLKKLTDLRAALQGEEDPSQVGQYVPLSETLAGPHSSEPEFSAIIDDIKHQVLSSERAVVALKQDRIEDCLEECAWVLSRMRHHKLFLKLKANAEERELALVDEYSNCASRIKELLAEGRLAEADKLCSDASAKLPQFTDLKELAAEIAQRKSEQNLHQQQNVESAHRLVERGEKSLRERQFKVAEQSFANSLKLLPENKNLPGHIVAILHGYARSVVRENGDSANEALKIAERLVPGTVVPKDLVESLRQKREQAKAEAVRWSSLDRIGDLDRQAESSKKRADLVALRDEAQKNNFSESDHADVKEASVSLLDKIDAKIAAFDQRKSRRPAIVRVLGLAATILIGIGLVYFLNKRTTLPANALTPAKPATVETAAIPKAQPVPAPAPVQQAPVPEVKAAPPSSVLDATLAPIPTKRAATIQIRGAVGTEIKLDGVLLAKSAKKLLTKQVAAGSHSIELSRGGYLSKTITRSLAPGQVLVLTGPVLQLESSDALSLAAERQDWKNVQKNTNLPSLETFMSRYPNGLHVALAREKADGLRWQAVDKGNPDSLRAFVAKYPSSAYVSEASKDLDTILIARESKAEDNDWTNADHSNRAALQDFLRKHPNGRHAPTASTALAELERNTRKAELQNVEEAAWRKVNQQDEASLEAYLRDAPAASRYRPQAEVSLATLRLSRKRKENATADMAAVLGVLSRFANAWNSKDLNSILALQRNLDKRTVKAELAHVKELVMEISPASPPQIDGSQAVVLCRRQASQTFSDGTRKEVPETLVSYVLAKQDGNWVIEGTR